MGIGVLCKSFIGYWFLHSLVKFLQLMAAFSMGLVVIMVAGDSVGHGSIDSSAIYVGKFMSNSRADFACALQFPPLGLSRLQSLV